MFEQVKVHVPPPTACLLNFVMSLEFIFPDPMRVLRTPPYLGDSVPHFRRRRGFPTLRSSGFFRVMTQFFFLSLSYRFGPSRAVGLATMTSADSSAAFLSSCDANTLLGAPEVSPGSSHTLSRLCPPHLLPCLPCKYRALGLLAPSPGMAALYAIPVRQASVLLTASFRFRLTAGHPCCSARESVRIRLLPLTGRIGDFHP